MRLTRQPRFVTLALAAALTACGRVPAAQRARPGSIIILHDGKERGRRTARALAHALPSCSAPGTAW